MINRIADRASFAIIGALAIVLIGVLAGIVDAGPLDPPGVPGSTMKTLDQVEPRTPISSVPFVISTPGSYYLTRDITGIAAHGVQVTTNNVTIDLNGFTLRGVAGSAHGIAILQAYRNITVKNGMITEWGGTGLNATSSTAMIVSNVQASGNGSLGISVGANAVVSDCVVEGNGIIAAGGALGLLAGANSVVDNCIARDNTGAGISVGARSLVSRSIAFSNNLDGIVLANYATAENSTADENGDDGFLGTTATTIRDSTASNNAGDGIEIAANGVVVGNLAISNGVTDGAGIHTTGIGNHVESNYVTLNDRGIEVDSGQNLVIANNARQNTIEYDIIVTDNTVGPSIVGLGTITSTNPWGNFDH